MAPSNVVLGTQIWNLTMRFPELIIKIIDQKVMAKSSLNVDFTSLNILQLDIYPPYSLNLL